MVMLLSLAAAETGAVEVFDDFEDPYAMFPGWFLNGELRPTVDTTPAGDRDFLGPFGNDTVTCLHMDIQSCWDPDDPGQDILVTFFFDLFVIGDWRGNGDGTSEPSIWDLSIYHTGGPGPSLHTTFSHFGNQAYPNRFPGGSYPAGTGAVESGTLGYALDSVYQPCHPSRCLVVESEDSIMDLALEFSASGLGDGATWGLDNVFVSYVPVPEPPGMVLAAVGLAGLLRWARRRRNPAQRCSRTSRTPTVIGDRSASAATGRR
jgi:hypothetical protein